MATTQYIGARYVPLFYTASDNSNNWESGVQYDPLTIVTYLSQSYTSKIPVPASVGNPADNPTYWILTGAYSAQVEQYRQEVAAYQQSVEDYQDDVDAIMPTFNTLAAEYADVEFVGGAIRKTSDGWSILSSGGHMPKHLASVAERTDGGLDLDFDKVFTNVGSVCVTPDETLTRCGIGAGCSVALSGCKMVFSRTRNYAGMFDFDQNGEITMYSDPQYAGDIAQVLWDSNNNRFDIYFKDYVKGGYFNSINIQFARGAYEKIPVPTTNFLDDYRVTVTPGPNGLTGVGTRGTMYIEVTKGGYELRAQDFPIINNANFWVSGFMWK